MKKYRSLFPWRKYMAQCGHETKRKGKINAFGEIIKVKTKNVENIPYCLNCLEKAIVKCPWCGNIIFPGELVTLYSPRDPNYKIPEGTFVYSEEPLQLVGCQSSRCAESGADYCGRWAGDHVDRFESALEQCFRTGQPVITNF